MKTIAAKHAKNAFGELIDDARAQPIIISKHGRPVVVVLAVELFQELVDRPKTRKPTKQRSGRR